MTDKGLLRFVSECWKSMTDKDKEFVRDYNASIKHGDKTDKLTWPEGISIVTKVRRTSIEDKDEKKPAAKKRKGVSFDIGDDESNT